MTKRLTISGIEHMVGMLRKTPALLSLGSLAPLQKVGEQAARESQSCGCNAAKVYRSNAKIFELALANLGNGDHVLLKSMLNINELCYYVRKDGKLTKNCI